MDKKIAFPGDYVASCEEFVPGKNTFAQNDNIYATAYGDVTYDGHTVHVKGKAKTIEQPVIGDVLIGVIEGMMDTRAFVDCAPLEKEGVRMLSKISAVLPVSNIRKGFVENIRDEIRIGDVIRAKVNAVLPNVELTITYPEYGVIKAFCSRCRNTMVLNDRKLICSKCEHVETRKLAQL
ncbi:MAG: exosome complex RNA-binding protein Csl4 [Candidatus Micrarchaeota archaeon]|nr:exosome complex RNA-binding protein Csl4 [Candidatus Micrarchaeota archaeon]